MPNAIGILAHQKSVRVERAIVAYEESGEGFPLLALHGFYPDRRIMTGCIEPLFDETDRAAVTPGASYGRPGGGKTRRSYRRIYPDLPFMGASSDPDSVRTSDDMLEVVAGFVRRVLPDGPFLLAGESYGGYLARGLVRLMPERISGLLFICPAVTARSEDRDAPAHEAARAKDGYSDGYDPSDVEKFEAVAVVRDRYCLERYFREILPGLEVARGDRLEALKAAAYAFSFDSMGRVDTYGAEEPFDVVFPAPTLFLLGRRDASVGWSDALRLHDRYPRASYVVLDGVGHNLQIEASGLFEAHVGAWLSACESEAAGLGKA